MQRQANNLKRGDYIEDYLLRLRCALIMNLPDAGSEIEFINHTRKIVNEDIDHILNAVKSGAPQEGNNI